MKKLILTLSALLCAAALGAQMMPDSTVQVIAYWEVGDKMDYTYVEKLFDLDAEGNETLTMSSTQSLHLEVVEKTDSTYTLQYHTENIDLGDLTPKLTARENAAMPDIVYRIRTNHLGTFLGIVDIDQSRESVLQRLPVIAKASMRNLSPADRKKIKEEDLVEMLKQKYSSNEVLAAAVSAVVSPLLFYHGARLDTTGTYHLKMKFASLLYSGGTTELENNFAVDPSLTDEYSVIIRSEAVGDEKDLLPMILDRTFANLKQTQGLVDDDYNDFLDAMDEELLENPIKASFEEYTTEEIDLDTGWPLQWIYDRIEKFSQGGTFRGLRFSRELVLEDKIGGE